MPTFSASDIIVACAAVAIIIALVIYILISGKRSDKQLLASLQQAFAKTPTRPAQEADIRAYYNAATKITSLGDSSCPESQTHRQRRVIDEQTWDDLEMSQIFLRLDACQSTVGDECLYARLRNLDSAANDANAVEEIIELCKTNPELRLKLQFFLASAGKQAGNGLGVLICELGEKYHAKHHGKQRLLNIGEDKAGGRAANNDTEALGSPAKSGGANHVGGNTANAKGFSTLIKRYVYAVLSVLPILMIPVCVLAPILGFPAIVTTLVVNGLVHYRSERNNARDYQSLRYLSALLWSTKKILALLPDNGSDSGSNSGSDSGSDNSSANSSANDTRTNNRDISQNPLIMSLAKSYPVFARAGGAISGAVQRNSWYTEAELLREFYEIFFLVRVRHYYRAMRLLEENHALLRLLYHSFGTLDVAIAIHSFRESLPYYALPKFCAPSAAQCNNHLQADELYHPLVNNPVANSITLSRGNLITGSNASGKSTFIIAIGINAILAQTINTCTAKSLQMQPMLVISAMAARDSVLAKESYFIAETRALKRLIDATYTHPCLCLIDEILRGTNTVERIAASAAILKSLVASASDDTQNASQLNADTAARATANAAEDSTAGATAGTSANATTGEARQQASGASAQKTADTATGETRQQAGSPSQNNIVLAATHDLELVDLLGASYKNYHFEEIVGSETVEFDYLIKDGKATGRNAIKLLALLGFEPSIVTEANDIAERYQDGSEKRTTP